MISEPEDGRPIDIGLGYPGIVLCDMAHCLVRGEHAEYFELAPTLDEDCNWLKRTATHSYLLIGYWWVCTYCDHAEQYCCCDGKAEDLE